MECIGSTVRPVSEVGIASQTSNKGSQPSMAHLIKQGCAMLKCVQKKGLMIRTHGDDQISGVQ